MTNRRAPDFFLVGAAKSGTTSLWHYFGEHPEIYVTSDPGLKELGFFASDHGMQDWSAYLDHFSEAKQDQLIGEVCNSYLSDTTCAERIHEELPHSKILIILRNPVERAASLHNWMVREGYESIRKFEDALKAEEDRWQNKDFRRRNTHGNYRNYLYKRSGLYFAQINRYFKAFDESQIHIELFDDLRAKPQETLKRIFSFLDVDSSFEPEFTVLNKSGGIKYPKLQFFIRHQLPKFRRALGLPKGLLGEPLGE